MFTAAVTSRFLYLLASASENRSKLTYLGKMRNISLSIRNYISRVAGFPNMEKVVYLGTVTRKL